MRRLQAALLAVLVLAAGGCANRGRAEPKTVQRTEQIPMTLSIELRGDFTATIEDRTVTTQLVMLDTDDPELADSRIYGIDTGLPVTSGASAVGVGFALVPYRGPGKYTIREGSIQDAVDPAKAEDPNLERSSIKVLWKPDDAVEEVYDFYRRDKSCRVKIDKDGEGGELDCPRLTNEERRQHFSLKLRWKFVDQQQPVTMRSGLTTRG